MGKILVLTCMGLFTKLEAAFPPFTLKNLDGSTFSSVEHVGKKPMVMTFWEASHPKSNKILKNFQKLKKQNPDVLFLAVSIDDSRTASAVRPLVQGHQYDFTVLMDTDSNVMRSLVTTTDTPYTLAISQKGNVVWRFSGYLMGDQPQLASTIESLEAESKP